MMSMYTMYLASPNILKEFDLSIACLFTSAQFSTPLYKVNLHFVFLEDTLLILYFIQHVLLFVCPLCNYTCIFHYYLGTFFM